MKDIGGTGIADMIYDEKDNIKYAYIVLDAEVLKKEPLINGRRGKSRLPLKKIKITT